MELEILEYNGMTRHKNTFIALNQNHFFQVFNYFLLNKYYTYVLTYTNITYVLIYTYIKIYMCI